MQNVQALVKVAEWLEDGAKHVTTPFGHKLADFNMEEAVQGKGGCGTACCIAGALVQFEGLIEPVVGYETANFFDTEDDDEVVVGVGTLAREHLGIPSRTADELFTPWDFFESEDFDEFSYPARAAAVVRHFIATGKVHWDKFDENGELV